MQNRRAVEYRVRIVQADHLPDYLVQPQARVLLRRHRQHFLRCLLPAVFWQLVQERLDVRKRLGQREPSRRPLLLLLHVGRLHPVRVE